MTPNELIRAWQARMGLSGAEAARRLGTPAQTYRNWIYNRTQPPGCAIVLCEYIEAFGYPVPNVHQQRRTP